MCRRGKSVGGGWRMSCMWFLLLLLEGHQSFASLRGEKSTELFYISLVYGDFLLGCFYGSFSSDEVETPEHHVE